MEKINLRELLNYALTMSGGVSVGVGVVIVLIVTIGMYKMDKWCVDSLVIRD